ncbi:hypothetical protein [Actinocorallia aurea]
MIPVAGAFVVTAFALAGPATAAHAAERPQVSATQIQQAQEPAEDAEPAKPATEAKKDDKDKPVHKRDSAAVKKAKAVCLATGAKDAKLAAKISEYDHARPTKAKRAEVATLKKQRAALAKTLSWCAQKGYATS